ncbi:MAG: hypothetical protein WD824_26775 [Cyclobacteriaceae bacterium]
MKRKSGKLAAQKLKSFEGLIRKLSAKEPIGEEDIRSLAVNASTRHALFGILDGFGRKELFPGEYFTLEKSAESFLVNWLEFPTELNATPDTIELFTKITLQENDHAIEYFVFKYKKTPPPSGLPNGWMLGVTGPFGSDSKPYDIPEKVFSRFNELGSISTTDEVRWVHANINRK